MSILSTFHEQGTTIVHGGVKAPRRFQPTFKGVNGELVHLHQKTKKEKNWVKTIKERG